MPHIFLGVESIAAGGRNGSQHRVGTVRFKIYSSDYSGAFHVILQHPFVRN